MTEELVNRIIGMLMLLWAKVSDEEHRNVIQSTIDELRAIDV